MANQSVTSPVLNVAAFFGCTEDQARAAYARNAAQLAKMAAKAHATGRKVNGYTERELSERAMRFDKLANS
jgi:hypothetical protein